MAQLARRHDERIITRLEELAQREDVSASFLVQILNDLRDTAAEHGVIEAARHGYLRSLAGFAPVDQC